MAEFQEVMQQLGRICASNYGECDICDLRPFCPSRTFIDKYEANGRAERLEKMVMSWAAEHPAPEYPTWGEWLNEQAVVIKIIDNGALIYEPDAKMRQPIPADIAQKLDIKPLPIVNGDCGSTNREDAINNLGIKLKEHQ